MRLSAAQSAATLGGLRATTASRHAAPTGVPYAARKPVCLQPAGSRSSSNQTEVPSLDSTPQRSATWSTKRRPRPADSSPPGAGAEGSKPCPPSFTSARTRPFEIAGSVGAGFSARRRRGVRRRPLRGHGREACRGSPECVGRRLAPAGPCAATVRSTADGRGALRSRRSAACHSADRAAQWRGPRGGS